ncbi:MAG: succinylglutamate desuccinylase/aspartoacylase family protein [Gloeobacterales cyanobacterium]
MQPNITTVPFHHLASGDVLSLQLYRFSDSSRGAKAGPKAYIQSNLHGAEIVGNAVIEQLIEWLITIEPHQFQGEVWLVPACNPLSTNQRTHYFSTGRFNPYDGKDWNRIFWEYETDPQSLLSFAQSQLPLDRATIEANYARLIQTQFAELADKLRSPSGAPLSEHYRFHLQSLCLDADYLIDIHSTSNQGLDYLYYFPHREQSAQFFGLNWGILIDQYDGGAFDEAFIKPWLALENCFAQLGRSLHFDREAWTLELGTGMQMKPDSIQKGVSGIQNYLLQKQVIRGVPNHPSDSKLPLYLTCTSKVIKYYAPYGGMVYPTVSLGETVVQGQVLYKLHCFNKQGQVPVHIEVLAEQRGIVYDLASNQAVNLGEYVLATF